MQQARRTNVTVENYYKAHDKEIPIGPLSEAEECAILLLPCVGARRYITGTAITVLRRAIRQC